MDTRLDFHPIVPMNGVVVNRISLGLLDCDGKFQTGTRSPSTGTLQDLHMVVYWCETRDGRGAEGQRYETMTMKH